MQPPMCPDCFTGTLRGDVTPAGTEEVVHGIQTYVARPAAAPIGTVVLLTDAFGWTLRNTRALADAYATRVPCTVYVPDFMDGHALSQSLLSRTEAAPPPASNALARALQKTLTMLPLAPALLTFLYHTRQAVTHPRMQAFLAAERAAAPVVPLGVAGFCWGGLHAILLTHDVPQNSVTLGDGTIRPLVDCAFTAHPSLVSVPGDVKGVVRPLSLANGDDDQYMASDKMQVVTGILEGKEKEAGGARYEVVVYPGAKHGFAVRGDRADPLQRERGDKSEEQAVSWFRRWFGEPVRAVGGDAAAADGGGGEAA